LRSKGFRFAEYRYFYEVANCRSMRKAATILHVSPSALSRQIRKIEDLLGSEILERGRSGVRLTICGQYLLQHIRETFANEERLLAKIDEVNGLRRGHVRIACGDGFLPDLLGEAFEQFARQYPGITFEIKLGGRDYIANSVMEEEAELGLIFYPPADQRFSTLARSRQPLHVITSPQHVLAKRKVISLRTVGEHPLALLVGSHGVRQAIDAEAHKSRIKLEPRFTCNSITALRSFAERFGAVSILPTFATLPELAARRLVAIPLAEATLKSTEAHLFAKRTRPLTLPASELARSLAAGMQALGAAKQS
jgi:DNA-binding transcriptional LysR family regulator